MKESDTAVYMNDRQSHIMTIMREQNAISVSALASLMKVSEVTIRKDLTFLEEQHLLYRVHGSAILVNKYINDRSIAEKEHLFAEEKRAIGICAASFIMPRDTIMITSGSTTHAFACEIKAVEYLTVITTTFGVASALVSKSNIDVIQLGGMLRASSMSVIGPFAERMLADLSCSKLFIGIDGVDLEYGLTTTNHMEANLHRQMIESAQKVIVLADSSKFGRRGFSKICDLNQVDQIITDSSTPLNTIEKLQDSGIEVTVAQLSETE